MGSLSPTSQSEAYITTPKTQAVVDDYSKYVGGGFAPYPVCIYPSRDPLPTASLSR